MPVRVCRKLARFDESYDRRPRDPEQIRRLPGGEHLRQRLDVHRGSLADGPQEPEHRPGGIATEDH